MKYKIGDKVKLIKLNYVLDEFNSIGIIESIDIGAYFINFNYYFRARLYYEDEIELIERIKCPKYLK